MDRCRRSRAACRPAPETSEDAATHGSGGKTKWIALSVILFVLFAGGSAFILFAARRRDAEEEEKNAKPKNRKNKRKLQSTH